MRGIANDVVRNAFLLVVRAVKKPKLIPNWRAALSHYSTKALALGAGIQGAWLVFPQDWKDDLGAGVVTWMARLTAFILVAGLVGKFVDQS